MHTRRYPTPARMIFSFVILSCIFFSFWWNRYLGLTLDGWFQTFGREIIGGKIPYKDFYMFTMPLHAIKIGILDYFFGGQLYLIHLEGAAERVLLCIVVIYWLKRYFSYNYVFLSVFTALIVFCADVTDVLNYYQHDAILYTALVILLLSNVTDDFSGRILPAAAAGLFAGCAMITRQTSGILVFLAATTILLFLVLNNRNKDLYRPFFAFFATGALTFGILILWLVRNDALEPFIDQVFVNGPSSKGSLTMILLRPFEVNLTMVLSAAAAGAAYIATSSPHLRKLLCVVTFTYRRQHVILFALSAIGAGVLGGVIFKVIFNEPVLPEPWFSLLNRVRTIRFIAVYFTLFSLILIFLGCLFRALFRKTDKYNDWLLLGSAISLACTYGNSLSWRAYEPMILPGFPLVFCYFMARGSNSKCEAAPHSAQAASFGGYEFCFWIFLWVVAASTCLTKAVIPYCWASWTQGNVFFSGANINNRITRGLTVSSETAVEVERIVATIKEHSRSRDDVFVFPGMPLIYLLTDHAPKTFSFVQYADVYPYYVALKEAEQLVANMPRIMVVTRVDVDEWHFWSMTYFFGGDHITGEEVLWNTLKVMKTKYNVVYTAKLPASAPIEVWVKRQ